MKKWAMFSLIFLCAVAQATALNSIRLFGVKPDLLLVCVVIASLDFNPRWALVFSLLSGVCRDSLGIYPIGFNVVLFVLWSVLIMRLKRDMSFDNVFISVGLMAVIVLVHHLLIGLASLYMGNYIPAGVFLRIIIIETVYTAACLPLLKKAELL
jgi:rod shape-determining protein MreD